ncbi:hypothetical protein TNCV_3011891 [Trichonephila clavipes]|nr:hypothetical protein TNCV_3011891 [Trichonephila clavipes]
MQIVITCIVKDKRRQRYSLVSFRTTQNIIPCTSHETLNETFEDQISDFDVDASGSESHFTVIDTLRLIQTHLLILSRSISRMVLFSTIPICWFHGSIVIYCGTQQFNFLTKINASGVLTVVL